MSPYVTPTREALRRLQDATDWIGKHGAKDPELTGYAAYDYMHLFRSRGARAYVVSYGRSGTAKAGRAGRSG
jgi:hypothetical protein